MPAVLASLGDLDSLCTLQSMGRRRRRVVRCLCGALVASSRVRSPSPRTTGQSESIGSSAVEAAAVASGPRDSDMCDRLASDRVPMPLSRIIVAALGLENARMLVQHSPRTCVRRLLNVPLHCERARG